MFMVKKRKFHLIRCDAISGSLHFRILLKEFIHRCCSRCGKISIEIRESVLRNDKKKKKKATSSSERPLTEEIWLMKDM